MEHLYSIEVMRHASQLVRNRPLQQPDGSVAMVTKICGSAITLDIHMDGDTVADFSQQLNACILGQASASILASNIIGASIKEIEIATGHLQAMLKHGTKVPPGRFKDLNALAGVRNNPSRHDATLMPFRAAIKAMTLAIDARPT